MTEPTRPERKTDPETELARLRALTLLPEVHLDGNFYHAVDQLRTAVEAMDIAMHGIDLDRAMLPDSTPDCEVRRRWAAQFVILRNIFWDVERRVLDIHTDVRKLLALE